MSCDAVVRSLSSPLFLVSASVDSERVCDWGRRAQLAGHTERKERRGACQSKQPPRAEKRKPQKKARKAEVVILRRRSCAKAEAVFVTHPVGPPFDQRGYPSLAPHPFPRRHGKESQCRCVYVPRRETGRDRESVREPPAPGTPHAILIGIPVFGVIVKE